MNIRRDIFFILVLLALLVSCATSPDSYAQIDAGVQSGSFEHALASIDDEKGLARKNIYVTRNEVLLYLDRGMVNHYAGNYEQSSRDLQMAEQLIEDAFTKSISQEIGTFLTNDNARNYAGEDYEDLYINVFGALNYYHKGDLEGALVEIRRLNEKLLYLADNYQRARDKAASSNEKVNPDELPIEASSFSNSALARYLGMLFYRGTGRTDSARIENEELKKAFYLAPEMVFVLVQTFEKEQQVAYSQ